MESVHHFRNIQQQNRTGSFTDLRRGDCCYCFTLANFLHTSYVRPSFAAPDNSVGGHVENPLFSFGAAMYPDVRAYSHILYFGWLSDRKF